MGYIYMLTSPSGQSYVGQTEGTVADRLKRHCKPSSKCKAIRNAIQYYGIEDFKIETIIQCDNSELNDYEIHFIAHYDTYYNGYNCTKGGEAPMRGRKHTEETKKLMSESHKGKILTKEHKRKIGEAGKGRKHTEESKKLMSEAQKGPKHPMYGKHLSEETKRRMSEAQKGPKNPMYGKHHSEETKKLMSESHKGPKHPNYGKHLSEETKRRMSEAKRKSYKITYYDGTFVIVPNLKKFAKDNEGMSYKSLGAYASNGKPYKKFGILKIEREI
jgi:group I intron endonuclease